MTLSILNQLFSRPVNGAKPWRFVAVGLTLLPLPALANVGTPNYLSMIVSLLLVVGLILVLAWVARRLNFAQPAGGAMKVVAMLPLGGKERLVVVDVQGQQYMLGVTSHQVRLIEKLAEPITSLPSGEFNLASLLNLGAKGDK